MSRPDIYIIPSNFNDGRQFRGINYRNIIEGGVMAYAAWRLFGLIPFVTKIRLVGGIIVALAFFAFGLVGINGESITQFIASFFAFRKNKKVLHFRRVGYVTKKERDKREQEYKKQIARRGADGKDKKSLKERFKRSKDPGRE